ncbi:hypothetical protein CRUP_038007, partial [Coryphaenoides rupestris]
MLLASMMGRLAKRRRRRRRRQLVTVRELQRVSV